MGMKVLRTIIALLLLLIAFLLGARSVLQAESWLDFRTHEYCIRWMNHTFKYEL